MWLIWVVLAGLVLAVIHASILVVRARRRHKPVEMRIIYLAAVSVFAALIGGIQFIGQPIWEQQRADAQRMAREQGLGDTVTGYDDLVTVHWSKDCTLPAYVLDGKIVLRGFDTALVLTADKADAFCEVLTSP